MADIFTDLRRKNGEDATFPPDIKEFCPMNGPCGLYVLDLFTKTIPIYRLPPNLPPNLGILPIILSGLESWTVNEE